MRPRMSLKVMTQKTMTRMMMKVLTTTIQVLPVPAPRVWWRTRPEQL
jgi:hypothetical protein